ncbi:MAG: hypothetical protein AAF333_13165 [Planctomycetota bacterium]
MTLTPDIPNPRPAAIFLCDESGVMARPWADAGLECWCVDVAHWIRKPRQEGNIHFVWGDCRSWAPPPEVVPVLLCGFSPCTHLAVSGARDFAAKGWPMLRDGMDLFMACLFAARWARCPYLLENPVGRISGIHHPPDLIFDPCDFGGYLDPPGDAYTKKTCLWTGGGFVMPQPKRVEPVQGSKMHRMTPGPDRQRLRSQTPPGFAQAVFEANRERVLATTTI